MQLYLKGGFFEEFEVKLPHCDPELSFEDNVDIRKAFMDYKVKELKSIRRKQISKCHGDFQIHIILQSRLNTMEFSQQEINSINYDPDKFSDKPRSRKSGVKRA